MIFNLVYCRVKFGGANGCTHENNGDHYNCGRCFSYLVVVSLIFEGHDHDDEHDYSYVEELYEKLEYTNTVSMN